MRGSATITQVVGPARFDLVFSKTLPRSNIGFHQPVVDVYIANPQVRCDDLCSFARPSEGTRRDSVDGDSIYKEPLGSRSRLCSSRGRELGIGTTLPFAQYVPFRFTVANDDCGCRGVMLGHEMQGGRVAASVR